MTWAEKSNDLREGLSALGLGFDTDPGQLRRAYLAAVKAAHPDRPGGDPARLRRVVDAYNFLCAQPHPANDAATSSPGPTKSASASKSTLPRLEITPTEAALGGIRSMTLDGAGQVSVRLPAGLRAGDRLRVSGTLLQVQVSAGDGVAVVGDHVCVTVEVDRSTLAGGGLLDVPTPTGTIKAPVSPQDAIRGLVRVAGGGLPARGRNPQGHLYVRLCPPGSRARAR